jgi:uncharacterized protein (UPF0248 family)
VARRSRVYELLKKLVVLRERYQGYRVVVVDRAEASGLRRIPVDVIERVERSALVLADGTFIPLHRVVAVEDGSGVTVWSRFGGQQASEEA